MVSLAYILYFLCKQNATDMRANDRVGIFEMGTNTRKNQNTKQLVRVLYIPPFPSFACLVLLQYTCRIHCVYNTHTRIFSDDVIHGAKVE